MTVQVATCSAGQILTGQIILGSSGAPIMGELSVPEYQRPYCWQDTQLHNLLVDIQSHTEMTSGLAYYLGSLILHQQNGKLNIIDGQQRITTLAIMACLLGANQALPLVYEHPISQLQIKHNIKWLQKHPERWRSLIDFNLLQFTLVITQSEDDAYRFFETQNTGGVRLGGEDIIKAHHLRAVDKLYQSQFAKQWEALGPLDNTVKALLKGRYWQGVNSRELPSHRQRKQTRDCIVWELAQQTGIGADVAFGRVLRDTGLAGQVTQQSAQQGYEVRQPLNAGVNSIRYLSYFQSLYKRYWKQPDLPHLQGYQEFIIWLQNLEGCGYLQDLYEACLLLYISQFGENQLEVAAKKLFRVVYSRRISNQKAVRENSISAFVKKHPVLDWIALSYTPKQCFAYLDNFTLQVDPSNLNINSVKKRYMDKVNIQFSLGLMPEQYEKDFALVFTHKVAGWPA